MNLILEHLVIQHLVLVIVAAVSIVVWLGVRLLLWRGYPIYFLTDLGKVIVVAVSIVVSLGLLLLLVDGIWTLLLSESWILDLTDLELVIFVAVSIVVSLGLLLLLVDGILFLMYKIGDLLADRRSALGSEDDDHCVSRFILPQVVVLDSQSQDVVIDKVTFVYVGAMASCVLERTIDIDSNKKLLRRLFPGRAYRAAIEDAYHKIHSSGNYLELCGGMFPEVFREREADFYSYLADYSNKVNDRKAS